MPASRIRTTGLLAVAALVSAGLVAASSAEAAAPAAAAPGAPGAAAPAAAVAAVAAAAADDLTGDIVFSTPSGTFAGQQSVGLSTGLAGAQIRYTTDGTLPSASSPIYPGTPITVTATTQLRAQAFVDGAAAGEPGTALYVARGIEATHDLPLVVVDNYGGGTPTREDHDAAVLVMAPQNGTTSLAAAPSVATRAAFRLRGQSSSNFEKAPYRLEFHDNADEDADHPVLGMPADSDWVLRGPFPDKSLVRDALAYGLGRDMGLHAPRYAFVELYVNTDRNGLAANDYRGVYLLDETIKRGDDRLDIKKLKKSDLAEPEISGGYIMQFNWMASEPPLLACTRPTPQAPCWSDLELVEPDDAPAEQQAWITAYVQRFHDSLRSANPADPTTGYPAYIDVDSFVDRIIHNELGKEGDAYVRSTHFFKDRGGKLTAGPLWDYDLAYNAVPAFGGGGGQSAVSGWQYAGFGANFGTGDWFQRLMADPAFLARVKNRWATLRRGVLSDAALRDRVTTLSAGLQNAAARNFQRWPNLGTASVGGFQTQTSQTWQQQLTILQNWLVQRAAWLDTGWAGGTPTTPTTTPSLTPTVTPTVTTTVTPTVTPTLTPTVTPTRTPTVTPTLTPTTSPPAGNRGCTATYRVTSQWNTGFQGDVTVTAGPVAISGWTVSWTYANGQTVTQSWNATLTRSGSSVSATNVSFNGSLGAGASTGFGFIGAWSGSNAVPTAVTCTAT